MKRNQPILILFLFSLVGFFVLNRFTNIAIDDFTYKHIFTDQAENYGHRVTSFSELIQSMSVHYMITNGRILLNGLAQLFLMSDNKFWFDLVNTVVFGLFQILCFKLLIAKKENLSVSGYLLFLILIWFLLPAPNQTLLWLDGSLNYLWAAVLVIGFYNTWLWIRSHQQTISPVLYPFLMLWGVICGLSHEVFSVGLSGALFLYYLFHIKTFRGGGLILVLGLFIGTAATVLAPGNMARLAAGSGEDSSLIRLVFQRIGGFLLSYQSMIPVWVLFFILIVMFMKNRTVFRKIWSNYFVLLWSIVISSLFILMAGAYQDRVFFGISLFSIIILLKLILDFKSDWLNQKWMQGFLLVAVLALFVEFGHVSAALHHNKAVFDRDEKVWRSSDDSVFILHPKEVNRFALNGLGGVDKTFWSNQVMSWYYGRRSMVFLPEDLYQNLYLSPSLIGEKHIIHLPSDSLDYYFSTDKSYLITPLPVSLQFQRKPVLVTFISAKPIPILSYTLKDKVVKWLLKRGSERIKEEQTSGYRLDTRCGSYLFFKRPSIIPLNQLDRITINK